MALILMPGTETSSAPAEESAASYSFAPTQDHLLLERSTIDKGRLIAAPDRARRMPNRGFVLAVGPDVGYRYEGGTRHVRIGGVPKVGDEVLFLEPGAFELDERGPIDKEKMVLVRENAVIAIVAHAEPEPTA